MPIHNNDGNIRNNFYTTSHLIQQQMNTYNILIHRYSNSCFILTKNQNYIWCIFIFGLIFGIFGNLLGIVYSREVRQGKSLRSSFLCNGYFVLSSLFNNFSNLIKRYKSYSEKNIWNNFLNIDIKNIHLHIIKYILII